MILLLISILWLAYSALEGVREGYYFSLKMTSGRFGEINEHTMFFIQRLIVSVAAVIPLVNNIWMVPVVLFSMALVFPFMHDGAYYLTRKKLDGIYPKGWADQSTTSTSKLTKFFTFPVRIVCFLLGVSALTFLTIKSF